MRELRDQANQEAENAWRAVSTYARHLAHALSRN